MSAAVLLECLERGAQLWTEDGDLRIRAPKGALTPELRDKLAANKAALVARLGAGRRFAAVSYAQRRLWFIDRYQPGTEAYAVESAVRVKGPLSEPAWRAAVADLVARHETLRTVFAEADGQPVQCIHDAVDAPVAIVDASDPSAGPEERLHAALRRLTRTFDLANGPLFRVVLLRLAPDDACIVFQMHHIAADGWSVRILLRDFAQAYAARADGRPPNWTPLAMEYAEWARRQRDRVERGDGGCAAYWAEALSGALPVLDLPADYPRGRKDAFDGGRTIRVVAAPQAAAFRQMLKNEGATAFMGLLALYAVFLRRCTGQREVMIGYPVAGRDEPGVEEAIGLFATMLPMRIALPDGAAYRDILRSVKSVALDALSRQETPFEKLVEIVQPDRDTGRPPLVQTMFAMQNFARPEWRLPGLQAEPLTRGDIEAKFDLALVAREQGPALELRFDYDARLFAAETAERMLDRFLALFEAAVESPGAPIEALAWLTPADRADLEAFARSADYDAVEDLPPAHDAFAAAAARHPERPALTWRGESWSYGRLDAESTRLARHLAARNLPPQALVGVCLEPSPWTAAALLAVWKAGCAYVPLDPAYPAARLRDIAEQAGLALILVSAATASFAPDCGASVLEIERLAAAEPGPDGDLPGSDPGALAYVMFTSGSTGRPKGVQIAHGAFANFLASMQRIPGVQPGDTVLALTTLAFDIAGLEWFLPLVAGARIAIADRDDASDPKRLAALIDEAGVTVMQATPATYRMLLDSGWRGRPGLRLFCGGEAMSRELAGRLLATGAELWNLYGPTETTVWSTAARVEPGDGPVHIGRPIRNTRLYILDDAMRPVPPGVPGELWIGGAGLARGYWGLPDLTAARFVADPFVPGERIYRTGDLARFLRTGNVEYLGRADNQIKLRGFRIEPREIEAALERDNAIAEAVVVPRRLGAEGEALVAYCRIGGAEPNVDALRARLAEELPVYMIPARYVFLEAFPLTPNGKIDRKALPAPPDDRSVAEPFQEARNPLEADVARLFSDLLGVSPVGVWDNFFYLGGHSLLATQLNSRLRERFQIDLPLQTFFSAPTPAAVAEAIAANIGRREAGAIRPVSRDISEQLDHLEHVAFER